jgi:hypothetical protein
VIKAADQELIAPAAATAIRSLRSSERENADHKKPILMRKRMNSRIRSSSWKGHRRNASDGSIIEMASDIMGGMNGSARKNTKLQDEDEDEAAAAAAAGLMEIPSARHFQLLDDHGEAEDEEEEGGGVIHDPQALISLVAAADLVAVRGRESAAAIRIQSAFRAYLVNHSTYAIHSSI